MGRSRTSAWFGTHVASIVARALSVELAKAIADVPAGSIVGPEHLRREACRSGVAGVHARSDRAHSLGKDLQYE